MKPKRPEVMTIETQESITDKKLRIAAFGYRALPPDNGSAGAETFANELYSRLAAQGHEITVYCRTYQGGSRALLKTFNKLKLVHLRTTKKSGFDSFIHSFLCTIHIIIRNTGDVIHISNGGNSFWALPLRMSGKRVYVTQDGVDWNREKWKWYARLFLRLSMYTTAYAPNRTMFDNVFVKDLFEGKFHRKYTFIPHGANFRRPKSLEGLREYGLEEKDYFLFVGRFIPDKGIHYLIEAFETVTTQKKLVIVGGSPNSNAEYERKIRRTTDARIQFLGFIYGDNVLQLINGAYSYIQPSDVEGMSPIILTAMGIGTPIICSNIQENRYVVGETALLFEKSDVDSLKRQIEKALFDPRMLLAKAKQAQERALHLFSWDTIAETYEIIFKGQQPPNDRWNSHDPTCFREQEHM